MHLGQLLTGLALSIVERKKNGEVINHWEPFQVLYKKTKEMAKYVCDKKNKRLDALLRFVESIGKLFRVINIPNSTRVCGVWLLIKDSLCEMHALRLYGMELSAFDNLVLSREEWKQLAEFEAVMRTACVFCFGVQADRVEVACEIIFMLSRMKMAYEETTEYDVVDTSGSWNGDTAFDDLPRIKMTREPNQQNSLSTASIELINRFRRSYDEYFAIVNPDRLLAMMVHPMMATHGFEQLEIIRDDGGGTFNQAKQILIDNILEATKKMKFKSTSEDQGPADQGPAGAAAPSHENQRKSKAERLKELQNKKRVKSLISRMTQEDYVRKAVDEYLNEDHPPRELLKDQCRRMGAYVEPEDGAIDWDTMDEEKYSEYMPQIDWEKVEDFDILYILSQFDLLEWWKSVGAKKYPIIVLVALIILALPPSNAFLERIFSTCTWFDNCLRQSLKFKRYEMSVLLAVNTAFLANCTPSAEEGKSIVEKVIEIFEKEDELFDAAMDLGLDPDAENFEDESGDDD